MDDPNRNTRSPHRNPDRSGQEDKHRQPMNESPEDMAREGYSVLDRAGRYGNKEREGLARPDYGYRMYPLDFDFDD